MAHEHIVVDTDTHFRIDKATREISTLTGNAIIMQYDHNSERFTFEAPRMIDGHDMMQCNQVQVHYINIGATAEETNADVYDVVDLSVSEEDENKVILSWLISGNATKFAGVLNFLIKFNCVIDGVVEYAWNTAIYKAVTVSNGMNNGEAIAEEYSDLLADWEARIEALERGGVSGAVLSVNGNNPDKNGNVTIDFTEPVNEALAQAKASGVFDGKDGEDGADGAKGDKGDTGAAGANGVSCTHSWNGTTLSVTSASGTSSANLKGEKGDKGDKGDTGAPGTNGQDGTNGKDGADGKTPVKGTDYYTEADKTEMVSRVLSALPTWNGGSY